MTAKDVHTRIAELAKCDDPEALHSAEDALRDEVLRAIAEGAPNPRELAAACYNGLKTLRPDLERWYG